MSGVGAPTRSLRQANRNANSASAASTPNTMRKPIHRLPAPSTNTSLSAQAIASRAKITAKIPNTAPAPTATAPFPMLVTFWLTSALASSISSRTSTPIRSETSVIAWATFSERPLLAGKALEDQGEQETTAERGSHRQLWTFVDLGCDLLAGALRATVRALERVLHRGGVQRALGFVAHSGGSSPNMRSQINAAARFAAMLARAPVPASRPDQIRRLTKGLSVIGQGFKQTGRRHSRSCARWRAA